MCRWDVLSDYITWAALYWLITCFDVIFVEVTWCIQYTAAWWRYHKMCFGKCIYCDCLVTVYGLISFTALNSLLIFPTFSHVLVQLGVSLYSLLNTVTQIVCYCRASCHCQVYAFYTFHDVDKFNSISHVMVASNGHTNTGGILFSTLMSAHVSL